jgi:hypothetical protein
VRVAFVYAVAAAFSERALAWVYARVMREMGVRPATSAENNSAASP